MNQTSGKSSVISRLKIVEGHLKKVREMAENGVYCIDILHQTQAIESALKEIDNIILENHLNTCVVNSIKKGKAKEAINEIMTVFKKAKKSK